MATAFIKKLAIAMKSDMETGFTLDDIGLVVQSYVDGACSFGETWQSPGLSDEAFTSLCDAVEAESPFVKADTRLVALGQRAARDCRAEQLSEARAFSCDF